MTPRTVHTPAGIGALSAAALLWACHSRPSSIHLSTVRRSPLAPAVPALIHPARYVATDEANASFDHAAKPSELPRLEPALIDGVRVWVERAVILASHPFPDYLLGFSSLPARLGGGFVFWSSDRTYRAKEFSGELVAVVDVGAIGGVRPWFHTAILRTELGLFELDPKSGGVQRLELAGVAELRAQDARRALRVDQVGRAAFTIDAGARWIDIRATQGVAASGIGVGEGGELLVLGPNTPELVLDPEGQLVPWAVRSRPGEANESEGEARPRVDWPGDFAPVPAPSSMTLPDSVAGAIFSGALLPGGRMLVVREQMLSILSAADAQPLAVAGLLGVAADYARCQPIMAGPWGKRPQADVLLACTHDRGAHVLWLDSSLAAPKLEATFPEPGGFVAGLSGRFGFAGRCGTDPPGVADFHIPDGSRGASAGAIEEPPDESETAGSETAEPHSDGSAYFCVRAGAGDWVDRRLSGQDARGLYRFLPGDDATVTALVLTAPGGSTGASTPPASHEGIRVVRIHPSDPALHGGRFPPIAPIRAELPYRSIESDFWLDDRDGSIRGWLLLPGSKDKPGPEPAEPPAEQWGAHAAGVRISLDGKIDVYPLPEGVVAVVRGGPFALALAQADGGDAYYETKDGGQTWHPVEGPPAMGISPAAAPGDLSGCSAAGCTWGGGIVRLGWGSSDKPVLPRAAPSAPAAASGGVHVQRPSPIVLRCDLKAAREPARSGGVNGSSNPITLFSRSKRLGTVQQGTWTADVAVAFGPTASRRISLRSASLDGLAGAPVPLLTSARASPVDLVLLGRTGMAGDQAPGFRIGPGNTLHAWDYPGRIDVMAELSGGDLVAFDSEHSTILLARGDAVQPIFRLTRVPDVSRTSFTLARRADAPGLALAGFSTSSGDIFTGAVDLVRREVDPLVTAGRLDSLTPADAPVCRAPVSKGPAYRMLADVNVSFSLSRPGDEKIAEPSLRAAALLVAMPGRVCLEGLIVQVPGKEEATVSVHFAAGGAARLWDAGEARPAQCKIVVASP